MSKPKNNHEKRAGLHCAIWEISYELYETLTSLTTIERLISHAIYKQSVKILLPIPVYKQE